MSPTGNFEQRTRDPFAQQPAMAPLGVHVALVEAGRVVLGVSRDVEWTPQHGFVPAGVQAFPFDLHAAGRRWTPTMTATVMTLTSRDDVRH
jgi:hypothetical protein